LEKFVYIDWINSSINPLILHYSDTKCSNSEPEGQVE